MTFLQSGFQSQGVCVGSSWETSAFVFWSPDGFTGLMSSKQGASRFESAARRPAPCRSPASQNGRQPTPDEETSVVMVKHDDIRLVFLPRVALLCCRLLSGSKGPLRRYSAFPASVIAILNSVQTIILASDLLVRCLCLTAEPPTVPFPDTMEFLLVRKISGLSTPAHNRDTVDVAVAPCR